MLPAPLQRLMSAVREGISYGFMSGLIVLFLILIGFPIRIENLALFSLFFVMFIVAGRLVRKFYDQGPAYLVKNVITMGAVTALMLFLFMSLINRWQTDGVDVKKYFDSINLKAISVLTGVPEAELHPNPPRNPLTGDYPEGAQLRTDPMRLTFDSNTALHLKLGLAKSAWADVNLVIGGFYGFLIVLVGSAFLGGVVAWLMIFTEIGRRRAALNARFADNPVSHWLVMLMPLLLFAFLWLTVSQNGNDPVIRIKENRQELQLLVGFGMILFGLIAVRVAEPTDWKLNYPLRLGIVIGVIGVLTALGIGRIVNDNLYIVATSGSPRGSEAITIALLVGLAAILIGQNAIALRNPARFETQFAGSIALMILFLMPMFLDQYQNDVMTLVGINILLGLGLNIVVGYAGLLDLGYVAFFALGSYTYAFLSSNQQNYDNSGESLGYKFAGNDDMVIRMAALITITVIVTAVVLTIGLTLWRRRQLHQVQRVAARPRLIDVPERPTAGVTLLLTVIAVSVSLIVAALLGRTAFYDNLFGGASPFLVGLVAGVVVSGLSGIALGIPVLRLRGDYLAIVTLGFGEIIRLLFNNLRDYTGGPQGVLQIPRPLPEDASGSVTYLIIVYLVFLGAGLVAFFSSRLKNSRTGRAWAAMKSDEDIAQSMGVNLVQSKLMAFAIGATFAGVGGVLFAARQRNIFPKDFNLEVSIEVLSLVIIGGMGSIPGVIMGAIALIGVPEVLRELSQYRILAFGALLVTMVIIRPEGLLPAPSPQMRAKAHALVHGEAPPDDDESLPREDDES